ncbi:hypothetical protein NTE_02952 [Candidatus Nitrososphaera evergladensis SR1]|uniref:C2H2-type domain-containing protein n=1 Tax=Candidatus Nitrososphaera evergladensis SR1 TaxID=1459636 RepID=A0A075MWF7_9ARCH|nr:hypothetical protein NTE_02952 [Candidatus Nitrososphaera evergladensis SR1]
MNNSSWVRKYDYLCEECGMAFASFQEYLEHHKLHHPKSIGTAIT